MFWNLENGQPAKTFSMNSEPIRSLAWSTDGQLASGSEDSTVIIWNLENGTPRQIFIGHRDIVRSVAWSPENQLASSSRDGTIILWSMDTGKPERVLSEQNADLTDAAEFSPASNLPQQNLIGNSGYIKTIAWSLNGQLASGSDDGTVTLWDLESGQALQVFTAHTNDVNTVSWSPDGRLVSGSGDTTLILWDTNPETWLMRVCQRVGRNLTKSEWEKYLSWKGSYDPANKTCPQWS
jgi:WD40 repeat protein